MDMINNDTVSLHINIIWNAVFVGCYVQLKLIHHLYYINIHLVRESLNVTDGHTSKMDQFKTLQVLQRQLNAIISEFVFWCNCINWCKLSLGSLGSVY